jgi:hypothetical protein
VLERKRGEARAREAKEMAEWKRKKKRREKLGLQVNDDFGSDENNAAFVRVSNFRKFEPPAKHCGNCQHSRWVDCAKPYTTCEKAADDYGACFTGPDAVCDFWE